MPVNLKRYNFNLIKISSLFVYLIPLSLLTGPFIPDLLLSFTSILFLYISIREKKYKYYRNKYFYYLVAFYLYLLICSFFSTDIISSLQSCFFYFRFIIFSLAIWFLIENNKNFIKLFTISLLLVFIFALIDGSFQYINGKNIMGYVPGAVNRLMLPLDDKLILGGFLARLFPLLIGLLIFYFNKNNLYLFFYGIIFIYIDVLTFLSGERTALALLTLSSFLIVILLSSYKKFRIFCIIFSLLIIIIISILNPEIKKRNIDYTIWQLHEKNYVSEGLETEKDESTTGRVLWFSMSHDLHIRTALRIFLDYPLIGAGPGQFRNLCSNHKYNIVNLYTDDPSASSCSTHPHNTYMQLLAETGLIGFGFIILLFFYLVKIFLFQLISAIGFKKNKTITDYQLCIAVSMVLSLWPIIPTQNFFNNWINIIYFLPVGFYLESIYKNKI